MPLPRARESRQVRVASLPQPPGPRRPARSLRGRSPSGPARPEQEREAKSTPGSAPQRCYPRTEIRRLRARSCCLSEACHNTVHGDGVLGTDRRLREQPPRVSPARRCRAGHPPAPPLRRGRHALHHRVRRAHAGARGRDGPRVHRPPSRRAPLASHPPLRWPSLDHVPATVFDAYPKLVRLHDAVDSHPRLKAWIAAH